MSTRRTLLTSLLTAALGIPALAQTAPAEPAAAPAAAPTVSVEGAAPVAAPVTRDKDTLSVDFPDEDIKTILRNVADLFELNLVVPDTLTGKTSIKLRDVTWKQIFTVVLSPAGYTYIEEGNIIKIVSNELLQQEPGTTEVFILNNAKAADIKPTIDGLIDAAGGGKIVIDARSNALVITERPSRMNRIRSIIDQLDKATDQVMIESKFVEVTDRDVRNIGVNWASLSGMQLSVGNIQQAYGKTSNQQSNNGNTSNYGNTSTTTNGNTTNNSNTGNINGSTTSSTNNSGQNAVTYVTSPTSLPNFATGNMALPGGQITGMPGSVPTNIAVANYTVDATTGVATYTSPNTYTGTIGSNAGTANSATTSTSLANAITSGIDNTVTNALNSLTGITNGGTTSRVATAVFSASDFNVIISALKTNNNAKIVSNPTIVTLNNSEAVLNIGQDFPIPRYTYNQERGTFEVAGFDYKSIGVNLKVTPQVNGRGVIKMIIEPEVSQRNGDSNFNGASIPIIATRKAKTQVSLKDGYTMGIGGLIASVTNHGGTAVPVLGAIPVLGRLFSSKSVNDEATNLLIFITAKTVSADGASPEEVFDPRAVEATGMSRDDLPPHRAAKGTDMFAPVPEKK